MAKVLRKNKIFPELIISSTAARALEFAEIIAEELNYKKKNILASKDIYMASEDEILEVLRKVDDKFNTVFLIGHNPVITQLVNSLCNHELDNMPTSGVFGIDFNVPDWSRIDYSDGNFRSFDYPKKYLS